MTDRDTSDRPIIGGAGGNTSGAGAAGSHVGDENELQTQARSSSDDQASSDDDGHGQSAGDDDSVDEAIGGGAGVSGTGGSPALSGRSTSEGNARPSIAIDPGDPGGMGGVRVKSGNPQGRPPGGVSPIDPEESSQG